mmetsp:Transcript_887/g.768  ORF Transcript_887/g.768 Transcript_887/m.768 type:complete len:138 (-) Transcript_887:36-449(-)
MLNPVQKKFLQTNMFVRNDENITRKHMLKPYFRLVKYLNNQNKFYNFSMIFGFNEGTFKFDDYHISSLDFYQKLKNLEIEWINPNLPEGEKHENARLDSEHFFSYLSSAMQNILGEISLKRVTEKLGPHLGLTQSQN